MCLIITACVLDKKKKDRLEILQLAGSCGLFG